MDEKSQSENNIIENEIIKSLRDKLNSGAKLSKKELKSQALEKLKKQTNYSENWHIQYAVERIMNQLPLNQAKHNPIIKILMWSTLIFFYFMLVFAIIDAVVINIFFGKLTFSEFVVDIIWGVVSVFFIIKLRKKLNIKPQLFKII